MKISSTIIEDLFARCLKVKEIIDASIARIDSIMNDKVEEETSAKEAKESSYEGADNIIGKKNGSKKEKNKQPKVGPTRVEPKPRLYNRMVKATELWKKFVVSTSRTRIGIGGVLGEICGSSWDKQNTQVSISIRLSRGPYKTAYVLEELAKQHHGYYYYYLVSTKGIQRRTWDPRIQDHSKQHLEDKGFITSRMVSFRSKEDDVSKISTSIFVTNFPENFSAKDLFHSCK
nr:nucleotide-binding alpha-beta plait domain-containing protein [Tanacetum cinerariifolium]